MSVSSSSSKREPFPTTIEGKIAAAEALKTDGNAAFQSEDWKLAIKKYSQVFAFINGLDSEGQGLQEYSRSLQRDQPRSEQLVLLRSLKVATSSNLAAAFLKVQKYDRALEYANAAIAVDATNIKAMFRRGLALMELGRLDDAKKQIKQVVVADASNVAARKVYADISERMAQQREREKQIMSSGFAAMYQRQAKEVVLASSSTSRLASSSSSTSSSTSS
jgi:tetratricopeptide (TPR) repeat protein